MTVSWKNQGSTCGNQWATFGNRETSWKNRRMIREIEECLQQTEKRIVSLNNKLSNTIEMTQETVTLLKCFGYSWLHIFHTIPHGMGTVDGNNTITSRRFWFLKQLDLKTTVDSKQAQLVKQFFFNSIFFSRKRVSCKEYPEDA